MTTSVLHAAPAAVSSASTINRAQSHAGVGKRVLVSILMFVLRFFVLVSVLLWPWAE